MRGKPGPGKTGAKRCNYVYKGTEGACREIIDAKTGQTILPRKKEGDGCNAIAKKGFDKCPSHLVNGGKGRPIIHGKYSQALRVKAAKSALVFDEVMKDPKALLTLEQDIALKRTFIIDELEQLPDFGEDAFLWGRAKKVLAMALSAKKAARKEALLKLLGEILNNGQAVDWRKWRITEMQEELRKHIDTEQKHRIALASNLTQKDLILAAVTAMSIISARIEDPQLCEEIAQDIKTAFFGDKIADSEDAIDAEFTVEDSSQLPVRAQ